MREEFLKRFWNSTVVSVTASFFAVVLGSCAAYGLSRFSYKFGFMRNSDISFFFLSQLILPPVVLALPFFIWIMRDQFSTSDKMNAATIPGRAIGITMVLKAFQIDKPSTKAASSNSVGIELS